MQSLYSRTKALLEGAKDQGVTLQRISADSGIPISWLSKFRNGVIADPGVNTVQKLHDFLERLESKAA